MPGGRLTQGDRRQIAAGLADGLAYAEIARTLKRPTSTISREVARNGGPTGYRADRAQKETGRRARRRRPAAGPTGRPGSPDGAGSGGRDRHELTRDAETVRVFTEEFATLIAETGLQRMAARVLASLFTTDSGALTAAELVHRLRVSPASVSKAIGYLEGLELVRRERDLRTRRERYAIDDDFWLKAWMTSARATEMWAETAQRGAEVLDAGTPAGARLDQMAQFFTRLANDMTGGSPTAGPATDDALTVLAALVEAGRPLTADQLAAALGWHSDRVAAAVEEAERHPGVTDPVAIQLTPTGAYTFRARADRLTMRQRDAVAPERS